MTTRGEHGEGSLVDGASNRPGRRSFDDALNPHPSVELVEQAGRSSVTIDDADVERAAFERAADVVTLVVAFAVPLEVRQRHGDARQCLGNLASVGSRVHGADAVAEGEPDGSASGGADCQRKWCG